MIDRDTVRVNVLAEVRNTQRELLLNVWDYGYGGETFERQEIDEFELTEFIVELIDKNTHVIQEEP